MSHYVEVFLFSVPCLAPGQNNKTFKQKSLLWYLSFKVKSQKDWPWLLKNFYFYFFCMFLLCWTSVVEGQAFINPDGHARNRQCVTDEITITSKFTQACIYSHEYVHLM